MNLYVITGTTRGLGKALADAVARDADNELVELARASEGAAKSASRIEVDLADTCAIERACDRLETVIRGKRYEKAVLINNAGVVEPVAPLEEVPADRLERNLVVNLIAPLLLMRRFVIATEGVAELRRIINISSGAGRRPIYGWAAYCAAKAGLDMASRVMMLEAQARGRRIEVASLAPGLIDTDMQATVRSKDAQDFADVERFRRMKAEGELRSPQAVAEDILRVECEGRLAADPVLDLRALAGE